MAIPPVPAPQFGVPPKEYEQRYMADLVRAFSQFVRQERNPGQGRFTFAVFTDLQDNDAGLEVGALFDHGGVLRVSRANEPFLAGGSMISSTGSVTVTIS